MKNQDKENITYTKEMLCRRIASSSQYDLRTVKNIYNSIESNIRELLSCADPSTDIIVKLFDGISINSSYIPEKEKINNLTGELIITKSKIKPKANITRYYCEKLTNDNK